MQVLAVSTPRNSDETQLLLKQHRLRAEVFSGRLGWNVEVAGGIEFDVFDELPPTYILAVAATGRVAGCARLLPALGPTMAQDVFPSLLRDGNLRAHSAMVESSRFCVDTNLREGRGEGSIHKTTLAMLAGITEWCLANRYGHGPSIREDPFPGQLASTAACGTNEGGSDHGRRRHTAGRSGYVPKAPPCQLSIAFHNPGQSSGVGEISVPASLPPPARSQTPGGARCADQHDLDDSNVVEIMLNPDGKLFIERLDHGVAAAGEMSPAAAEMVIGTVAHALQSEIDSDQPIISGELPIGGHRFEGLLPPIVAKPAFTIRRRASRLIPLEDYMRTGVLTRAQTDIIRSAIGSRLNIIISGGTGSGKTTLANAVIGEIVKSAPDDRLVILEDTAEIQCVAKNAVLLHTSDAIDMSRLLKSTMRLRPDRIVVGEVRDGAALTLLKAWNTGHPGGVATIHSNSATSALRRLEQLTAEASQQPMREVIGEAVDLIVSIERTPRGRRIRDVIHVERFVDGRYELQSDHPTAEQETRHVA